MTRADKTSLRSRALGVRIISCLTLLLISGCLEAAAEVRMGPVPAVLTASYDLLYREAPAGSLTVSGFETEPIRLGSGAVVPLPVLYVELARPDRASWLIRLAHGDQGALLSASYLCASMGGPSCPGNATSGYTVVIPDAARAPGLLGVSPFLLRDLREGDSGAYEVWDPSDPFEVRWTAERAEDDCLRMRLVPGASAKTRSPLWPTTGSLVLCDGLPLPREVADGPFAMRLRNITHEAALRDAPSDPELPAPRLEPGPCDARLPPHGPLVLPSQEYVAWARSNDGFVRAWFAKHPNGFAFPSYGIHDDVDPAAAAPGRFAVSYVVTGSLVLYDPDDGTVVSRLMRERWNHTVLGSESAMLPSLRLSSADPRLDGRAASCRPGSLNLRDAIREANPFKADLVEEGGALLPEVSGPWQGSAPWLRPFEGLIGVETVWEPEPWPARAYGEYVPRAGGSLAVAAVRFTSVDPAGNWLRWADGWASDFEGS